MYSLSMLIVLGGLLGLYVLWKSKAPRAPLPPGPKGLPIIGNVGSDLPRGGKDWEHWLKHKDLYGPISSVTTAGHTHIILNDANVATELLEKRSARYSSRPRMVMAHELSGSDIFVTVQNDHATVRAQRKCILSQLRSENALSSFYPQVDMVIRRFLLRVLQEPDKLIDHVKTGIGGVILKVAYGYTVEFHDHDPLVDLVSKTAFAFGRINQPTGYLVDSIPALKYLPSWFPGARFKKEAQEYRRGFDALANWPFAFARHQIKEGTHEPSFVSRLIEQKGSLLSPEEELKIKCSAASVYQAGYDTTASTITSFFLAMALFPAAQHRAQEEIDRVVGARLPTPDDRGKLPYVNALINEVLRWNPVVQIGIMHATTEDDIYEGYLIPKGASIVPNIWAFAHDPDVYSDPMSFRPERFLASDGHTPERDPHTLVFGFGRRICPGRPLVDFNSFLTIARSLAVFQIRKAMKDGREIDPIIDYQEGIVGHLSPFEVSIQSRSTEHEALIRSIEVEDSISRGDSAVLESVRV
ncbi:cytochrome P450 [Aspergillus pseudotamarii]|uniref:Cytochrome P450 n=1 Tax=Aspergillus pseudotamarii TaxID=132259 RepID=A0A5N6T1N4_ASPPS|nr:cytochrome P450 [Aspergillus pseudotamarii]KAE8140134.1 cytochrome P450 [Aspergillus pseudotamarii]